MARIKKKPERQQKMKHGDSMRSLAQISKEWQEKKDFEEMRDAELNVQPDSKREQRKKKRLQDKRKRLTERELSKKKKFVLKKKTKAHKKLHGVRTMDKVRAQNLKDLETVREVKSGTFYRGDTAKKISKAHQRLQASADIEKSSEYDKKFQKRLGSKLRRKRLKKIYSKLMK